MKLMNAQMPKSKSTNGHTKTNMKPPRRIPSEIISRIDRLGWLMTSNDRVERPATMTMPRPDAAHDTSRSARTHC